MGTGHSKDYTGIYETDVVTINKMLGTVAQKCGRTVDKALETVLQEMHVSGSRVPTISTYEWTMRSFVRNTGVEYVDDITREAIYKWLGSMKISNTSI